MKIKKYVLLKNNNIVKFYEDNKFGFSYVEREQDGIIFTRSALPCDVKKTSNNILDLLENKDLVELNGGDGNDNDVHMIVNVIDGDMITLDKLWIYKERDRDTIDAIYKRQTNGDYKRYEVV